MNEYNWLSKRIKGMTEKIRGLMNTRIDEWINETINWCMHA